MGKPTGVGAVLSGERLIGKEDEAIGASKTGIMSLSENARRALEKSMAPDTLMALKAHGGLKLHPLQKRGLSIQTTKRLVKRPKQPELVADSMVDKEKFGNWETTQFKTSIPLRSNSKQFFFVQLEQICLF